MTPEPADVLDAGTAILARINRRIAGFHGLVAPDVILSAIGLPFPRVNSASAARFTPDNADARIGDVVAWFEDLGIPFVWRLGPTDRPVDLRDRLEANGFALDPDEMPGMAARLVELPPVELPAGATIEIVRDAAVFRGWLDVMVAGFGMPAEIGDAYMAFATLGFDDELPVRSFLARLDGRPVATSLATLTGAGVVIANVATLEDVRGRGLGRAVTLAAMHAGAQAGAAIAVLQSTEMGSGVYRRLGFEAFGQYRVLLRLPD